MNSISYKIKLLLAYRDLFRTRVPLLYNRMISKSQQRARKAAADLRDKETVEVAFLLTIPGMWKLDYLFEALRADPRYHPYVVIYPYSHFKGFSRLEIWKTIVRTKQFIEQRGFEYIIPYDKKKHKWLNINKEYQPDIVFFTTPYRDIEPHYYYYNFKNKLTCYVPYAFQAMNAYKLNYDQIAINLYGLNFAETKMHLDFAKKYSRSKGENFVVSGYPGIEVYLHSEYISPDPWKAQTKTKKRIIWAPHHTIDNTDDFQCSTFLLNCNIMLKLAEKYKEEVQFAFRPHQLLKFKLQKMWGYQATEDYYRKWQTMENTQIEESGYIDLFIHSDAMIHDSGSFTTEYLYLHKPVMYLVASDNARQQFNKFGEKAFECHYQGRNEEQIEQFIQEVVIGGNDTMKEQRDMFYDSYLLPPNGHLPSENIVRTIDNFISPKEANKENNQ